MNIVKMQDNLKDLSDRQLLGTMQTGTVPEYLVIAELQRRKKARQDAAPQQQQSRGTVADELISGIAAVPAPNMQRFSAGGVVPFQTGGLTQNAEQERVIQMLLAEAGMPDTPENRRMIMQQGMRNYFPEQYADPNRQTGLTPDELAAESPPIEEPRIPRGLRPTKLDEALETRPPFEERYPFVSSILNPERISAELKEKVTATPGQARETLQAVGEKWPEFKERWDVAGTGLKSLVGDYISRATGIEPVREYVGRFGEGFSDPSPKVYPPNPEMMAREAAAAAQPAPEQPAASEQPTAPTQDEILRVGRADDATSTAPTAPAGPQVGTEQLAGMGEAELAQTREVAKERPDFFSPEALLALGIGMIAGGSKPGSTFGSAVGEGGLAMLQQVQSQRKAEAEREEAEMLEAGRMERTRMEQAGALQRAGINAAAYDRQLAALNLQRASELAKIELNAFTEPTSRARLLSARIEALKNDPKYAGKSKKDIQQEADAQLTQEELALRTRLKQLTLGQPGSRFGAPAADQSLLGPYNIRYQ